MYILLSPKLNKRLPQNLYRWKAYRPLQVEVLKTATGGRLKNLYRWKVYRPLQVEGLKTATGGRLKNRYRWKA